jgi:hypothetical protein
MQAYATRHIQGDNLTPITWKRAREIMRPVANDEEYFLAAFYVFSAAWLFMAIQARHKDAEMHAVCSLWNGHPFIIAAMNRRCLSEEEYAAMVHLFTLMPFDASELKHGFAHIASPEFAMEAAVEMMLDLLADGGNLAMAA